LGKWTSVSGIDLNQINVKRTGKTFNVQFDPAQLNALEQGGFEGFTPVITSITPISSPFQLLGVAPASYFRPFVSIGQLNKILYIY